MPELSGQWLGTLIYGNGFGQLEHEALVFVLELRSAEDGFSGMSKDVDGIGMRSGPASVSGFADNGSISFVAQYLEAPNLENQKLSGGGEQSGPEISFTGTWDPERQEFSGEWILLESYTAFSNVFFDNSGGRWSMRKD